MGSNCHHPCAGNLSLPIEGYWVEENNGVFQEVYGNVKDALSPFVTDNHYLLGSLVGANYVKFIIGNRWGATETKEYFNPKGLTNEDYDLLTITDNSVKTFLTNRPDLFTIFWDGKINGNLYPNTEVYTIRLLVKGCGVGPFVEVFHTVTSTISTNLNIINYMNNIEIDVDCCDDGGRILNNSPNETLFYRQFIELQNGFVLGNGETASHYSSGFIELKEGVNIDPGSNYNARIFECHASEEIFKRTDILHQFDEPIQSQNFIEGIKLFPNPTRETVTLIHAYQSIIECSIYDVFGKLIHTPFTKLSDNELHIDVKNLPKGLYYVTTRTKLEIYNSKLIVQ